MFHPLYVSLVRPHLEYASEIFSEIWKQIIEKATKVCYKSNTMHGVEFIDRLVAFKLPSLLYIRTSKDGHDNSL